MIKNLSGFKELAKRGHSNLIIDLKAISRDSIFE
jgi:hypothetical protein